MTGSAASTAAADLLAELIAHGVRDLVLSPGSRSQALALAATALDRAGLLRVHVRIDERVAGFTALGIARETRVPVAVVCTSGTAAGNLLPATMEAFHSGVPLLLLTADRPPELRGVGANQATMQPGIFGPFVRWTVDAPVPGSAPVSDVTDGTDDARPGGAGHAQGPDGLWNPARDAPDPSPDAAEPDRPTASGTTDEMPPAGRAAGEHAAHGPDGLWVPTADAATAGSTGVLESTDETAAARRGGAEHAAHGPDGVWVPTADAATAGSTGVSESTDETAAARRGGAEHAAHGPDGLWIPTADAATVWSGLGARAVEAAMGITGVGIPGVAGPVHLNLPAREPLSAAIEVTAVAGPVPTAPPSEPVVLARGPRTVVIAGADAGPDAEELAHAGGWPLIAEIVSGSRFGRLLVHGYRALLGDDSLGGRVERAVVFGHPTLSREVAALLARTEIDVIAVHGGGEPLDLNGRATAAPAVTVEPGAADRQWLGAWMTVSQAAAVDLSEAAPDQAGLYSGDKAERLGAVRAELDAVRRPVDRALLADAVWRATWPHDRLVFGSSRLVRVADQVLGGKKVPVHANRGLAGIDGTISTAIGIALASQADGSPGVTRVLLGDLAALHDVGALLLPAGEPAPRIQVIVGNDGGGTIFDGLEVADSAPQEDLDRAFYTPQTTGFADLAAAYGWQHLRVSTRSALDQALTSPVTGPRLIEVPLDR